MRIYVSFSLLDEIMRAPLSTRLHALRHPYPTCHLTQAHQQILLANIPMVGGSSQQVQSLSLMFRLQLLFIWFHCPLRSPVRYF